MKIYELEDELERIELPRRPQSAYKVFENKMFNHYKKKMPHLTNDEIQDLIAE